MRASEILLERIEAYRDSFHEMICNRLIGANNLERSIREVELWLDTLPPEERAEVEKRGASARLTADKDAIARTRRDAIEGYRETMSRLDERQAELEG
jgi:hypothetical protein